MSAGSRWKRARSIAGVSPVRIAIVGTWCASPRATAAVRDARERRAEVALDVDRQGLERARGRAPGSGRSGGRLRLEHQPVDAPQERCQRLAAAGRRQDQGRFAARDGRPALPLRRRRRGERVAEPVGYRWMKQLEHAARGRHLSILVAASERADPAASASCLVEVIAATRGIRQNERNPMFHQPASASRLAVADARPFRPRARICGARRRRTAARHVPSEVRASIVYG